MMQNRKIAITGGIGSGKSAFSAIVRDMEFPVYSCDEINAALLKDHEYLAALNLRFPGCVQNGILDKAALSERVFSDPEEHAALEAIAHPLIMRRLIEKMEKHPVAFAEVPLLYEGGFDNLFDAVIALRRDKQTRLNAVRERDGLTAEQILSRMTSQLDAGELDRKNCIIIENDGSLSELRQKALSALKQLSVRFPEIAEYLS